MDHFIQSILGQFMLVIFVIALFCAIADIRAEPIIGGFLDIIRALIVGVFKFSASLLSNLLYAILFGKKPPKR